MTKEDLIILADRWVAHTGKKLSSVSTYAVNDGKFLKHVKAGGGCTFRRVWNAGVWFEENWPEDLEWPSSIELPSVTASKRAAQC